MSFERARSVGYETIESFLIALGLEPNFVRKLTLTPNSVEVELFAKDEDGAKHVDLSTGEPTTEKHEWTID